MQTLPVSDMKRTQRRGWVICKNSRHGVIKRTAIVLLTLLSSTLILRPVYAQNVQPQSTVSQVLAEVAIQELGLAGPDAVGVCSNPSYPPTSASWCGQILAHFATASGAEYELWLIAQFTRPNPTITLIWIAIDPYMGYSELGHADSNAYANTAFTGDWPGIRDVVLALGSAYFPTRSYGGDCSQAGFPTWCSELDISNGGSYVVLNFGLSQTDLRGTALLGRFDDGWRVLVIPPLVDD
jgi:hypothetical protein